MIPFPDDVAAFLGRSGDAATIDLADTHLPTATAMVRAYVRGRGFTVDDPADDLALVIVASCARLVNNPELNRSENIAGYSVQPGAFLGWTLPELAVLHRYRRRAA